MTTEGGNTPDSCRCVYGVQDFIVLKELLWVLGKLVRMEEDFAIALLLRLKRCHLCLNRQNDLHCSSCLLYWQPKTKDMRLNNQIRHGMVSLYTMVYHLFLKGNLFYKNLETTHL